MKKSRILFAMILSMSMLFQVAYAYYNPSSSAVLSITKSDISPVPAEPGKDFLLDIIIENKGKTEAKKVKIEIKPDTSILLRDENERVIYEDSICAFCNVEKTYHLHADSQAVSGTYEIEIKATDESNVGIINTVNISVRGKPKLALSNVEVKPDIITPESKFTLSFYVENKGTGIASTLNVKTVTDDTQFIPIGTNSIIIERLNQNQSKQVQFDLLVKKGATPTGYSLPVQLSYESENAGNFSSKEIVGVQILGEAKLNIANIKTNPLLAKANEEMTLTIRIENAGNGDAKSVKASLLNLPASGVKEAFLGKIESNDDSPAVFTLAPSKSGEFDYLLLISYEDDIGKHEVKENLKLVVKGNNRDGALKIIIPIILIALATLGYYFYYRKKKTEK